MSRAVTYEVGITYCNDRNFTHSHTDLGEATQEYATMLGVALDPTLLHGDESKHVRMVTFLGFDELGQVVQHVNSPVFECDDRVAS